MLIYIYRADTIVNTIFSISLSFSRFLPLGCQTGCRLSPRYVAALFTSSCLVYVCVLADTGDPTHMSSS